MFRQQTISVVWKASGHRMFRKQTISMVWKASGHRMFRQQTFEILCGVESFRSLHVS